MRSLGLVCRRCAGWCSGWAACGACVIVCPVAEDVLEFGYGLELIVCCRVRRAFDGVGEGA
jgi:hypothetical protein